MKLMTITINCRSSKRSSSRASASITRSTTWLTTICQNGSKSIYAARRSRMKRPLKDLLGQISSENFQSIKQHAAERFVAMLRSPELTTSLNSYLDDALARLGPRTLAELLGNLNPDS